MTIPAEAFGDCSPSSLPAGAICKIRDRWSLRVDGGVRQDFKALLVVEGERTGQLIELKPSMAPSLTIIPPFGWFPACSGEVGTSAVDLETATWTLTSTGPIIIGAVDSRWDQEFFAYRVNGTCDDSYDRYGAKKRFFRWTAELEHSSNRFRSLHSLFAIDRASE